MPNDIHRSGGGLIGSNRDLVRAPAARKHYNDRNQRSQMQVHPSFYTAFTLRRNCGIGGIHSSATISFDCLTNFEMSSSVVAHEHIRR